MLPMIFKFLGGPTIGKVVDTSVRYLERKQEITESIPSGLRSRLRNDYHVGIGEAPRYLAYNFSIFYQVNKSRHFFFQYSATSFWVGNDLGLSHAFIQGGPGGKFGNRIQERSGKII